MCRVYASTTPDRYECVTRSVRLQGCVTSVRLENEFWDILEELAAEQDLSAGQFISQLYTEVIEERGEVGNLASLLRVACAIYLNNKASAATGGFAEPLLPKAAVAG
ncbi:ribbon-helix-helix domain-containing protein [Marinobacterium lutimaris]|uniref:Predicted DNA-binding protein, contains Ribbon-helix-helix (RHH) domain n=1 Tax=Marinobacterium lutimaris TaxID=568106 RepID=A0A1H6CYA4_9GAMM|nr:ribbon-helix-helix domain-containing protein [Marinobacterium lutimaris]SEG78040.1 Predicted DNA-binding protein, contains Ribbon-helix-helix (RHH) domain [Marinobacterium lutimaris]